MFRRPLTAIACCWIAGSGLTILLGGSRFWLMWAGITLVCPVLLAIGRWPLRRLAVLWLAFSLGAVYWQYYEARNISRIEYALSGGGETVDGLTAEQSSERGASAGLTAEQSGERGSSAGPTAERSAVQDPLDGLAVRMEGTIVSPVEVDGDRADFTLRLSRIGRSDGALKGPLEGGDIPGGEKVAVQLRLAAEEELSKAASWRRGQHIALTGSLKRPEPARNFEGFDYRRYLHNQRIHWLVKATGASALNVLPGKWSAAALLGEVDALRAYLGAQIERLFPGWQAGYMKGLLIGLQDELDPEKYAEFTQLGLTHILAISGSHVAINVAIVFWLLRLCRVSRETALIVMLFFVPAYVLITGFSPSVIRSGIMTTLGIYLLRRGKLKDSINVLSAAALMMLLWDPYFLLNVSFQLSFAVTAGLIVFVPLISPYFAWLPPKIRGTVAITLAAEIVSFPLTIFYFNQFSLLSLAANLLIVPVIGALALPMGTAALLLSFFAYRLGVWAAVPVRLLNTATFWATGWLGERSGFMTYWKSPSLLWIAGYYGAVFLLLYWSSRREKRHLTAAGVLDDETVPLSPAPAEIAASDKTRRYLAAFAGVHRQLGGQSPREFPLFRSSRSPLTSQTPLPFRPFRDSFISIALRIWPRDANRRREILRIAIAAGLALLIVSGYRTAYAKGVGHIEFIDVGQGDCALITAPSGVHILVDGGGTVSFRKASDSWRDRKEAFEVGAKTVVPLLKKRGIHRLDAVILTHGDQDHIGGLQAVLEQFPVEALVINGSLAESATMKKLMETALDRNIPVYSAARGMTMKPDAETKLDVLYPQAAAAGTEAEAIPFEEKQNHRSIVFLLQMSGARFLFTGDMDEAAEREVLEMAAADKETVGSEKEMSGADKQVAGGENGHPVDVMKVAHHGSKTSTSAEWLAYWRPEAVLISVGASNTYGHPHPAVMERLEAQGTGIFRTDRMGGVQLKVRGGRMHIRYKLAQ
ncbi:ComEC/Rec2 family competence protein [Paenibacillus macerans]|uniref:ComEC/Rec2 family competence protein n=1 Tax=Paenibacillus macerans TaxID=44252 RepID=UPI002DBD0F81|nr:ComEC/Rec2 family competence protein [Paenibacillus macerans]MEC0334034.1 ComEC/Rec2 family competence protein [Paenibacillus macerans]